MAASLDEIDNNISDQKQKQKQLQQKKQTNKKNGGRENFILI